MGSGCHYLAQVKRNNHKLWGRLALDTALSRPLSTCERHDGGHGRDVHRRVELFDARPEGLPGGWGHVRRVAKVRRWGTRGGREFHQVAFYILSGPATSALWVGRAIEGHWGIENRLHWVKDTALGEDRMTVRGGNQVALAAYLSNTAMNAVRMAGLRPGRDAFARLANKVGQMAGVLNIQRRE